MAICTGHLGKFYWTSNLEQMIWAIASPILQSIGNLLIGPRMRSSLKFNWSTNGKRPINTFFALRHRQSGPIKRTSVKVLK